MLAMWMGYSIFGGLGLAYVILVPLPIIVFSVLIQKKKAHKNQQDAQQSSQMRSIWTTPIPYLSIVLVASLLLFLVSKFI